MTRTTKLASHLTISQSYSKSTVVADILWPAVTYSTARASHGSHPVIAFSYEKMQSMYAALMIILNGLPAARRPSYSHWSCPSLPWQWQWTMHEP